MGRVRVGLERGIMGDEANKMEEDGSGRGRIGYMGYVGYIGCTGPR